MTLLELQREVELAIERSIEHGQSPDKVPVTIQIDDAPSGASIWSEDVEVCYDGDATASGCVLLAVISGQTSTKKATSSIEPVVARIEHRNADSQLQFRSVAELLMHLSLSAISTDEALKCCCGSPPYVDGDECPRCLCASALEEVKPLLLR